MISKYAIETQNAKLKTTTQVLRMEEEEGSMKDFYLLGYFSFLMKNFLHSPCSILHAYF